MRYMRGRPSRGDALKEKEIHVCQMLPCSASGMAVSRSTNPWARAREREAGGGGRRRQARLQRQGRAGRQAGAQQAQRVVDGKEDEEG